MKAIFILLIFLSFLGFTQSKKNPNVEKVANVYILRCDSIFYLNQGEFDSKRLIGAKKDDSVFIKKIINDAKNKSWFIQIKPMGGNCGGIGETAFNLVGLFNANGIDGNVMKTDSTENRYFGDISLIEAFQQRMSDMQLNEPKDSNEAKPYFQFVLRENGDILYSYDSTDFKHNLIEIKNPSSKRLVQLLDSVEKKLGIKLDENLILIRGDANLAYSKFKIVKEALKVKNIYKFKIVTTQ